LRKSLYEVLGVAEQADPEQIKSAYRRLARKLHPDVNPDRRADEAMSMVNEAYRVLADEGRRASYDASRTFGISGAPAADFEWGGGIFVRRRVSIVDLPSPVEDIEFIGKKSEVAIAGFDNTIRFCSTATGKPIDELHLEGGAASTLQWCGRAGLFAVGASEKSASIWQIRARRLVGAHRKKVDWISRVAVSPSGNVVALGSVHKTLLVASATTGETLYVRRKHDDAVTAVSINAAGSLIASGGNDQKVILWDVATGRERALLPQRTAVTGVEFSPDGALLAVTLVDNGVRVYELANGSLRATLWGHERPVEDVAFHPTHPYIATASRDGTAAVWSLTDGGVRHRLRKRSSAMKAVRFSADGGTLAVGGVDRCVDIYRVVAG
jgi:WD40 repeat protein